MPEAREYGTIAALPEAARAVFGQDAFSTLSWYEATLAASLPAGEAACFQVVSEGSRVLAVLPMRRRGGRLACLTTPYTCLWQPLLAPAADGREVGLALVPPWRRAGIVRLDCLATAGGAMFDGLCAGGLHILPFDHFGNWHLRVEGAGWDSYLAARPSQLRNAILRHTRRLMHSRGAKFHLVTSATGLEDAIADYETVYAASWKQPEPFSHFNPAFMRRSAADGTLRLGILRLDGRPIAAQFWLKHGDWAAMLKVAYDERCRTLSPGNVLSGLILRHLLDVERIAEFDLGRGDDAYKRDWTGARRQRVGALIANPLSMKGMIEIGKHASTSSLKRRSKQLLLG